MRWTWYWTAPIKAEFGDNLFFDWVRVACVLFAMLLMLTIARVVAESKRRAERMPFTQTCRFISLALFNISVALTEIAVAGTPATPRLLVNISAILFGAYGVWGMRQKQIRNPPVR